MDASKATLGQFFTHHPDVYRSMVSLVTHVRGRALEPSAGEGHLVEVLEKQRPGLDIDAVELDRRLAPQCDTRIEYADFFEWAETCQHRYDVIFGNPPYVAWKDADGSTKQAASVVKKRYSSKTNLYHLFIDRCVDLLADGGELIFIVPKEWLYTTSAAPLREKLSREGSVTHLVDCGEEKLFADASVPALLIFRFVKGVKDDTSYYATLDDHLNNRPSGRRLIMAGPRWALLADDDAEVVSRWGKLGDVFDVKVGFVTGLDAAYKVACPEGFEPGCVQQQVTTKRVGEWFINVNHIDREEDLPASVAEHLGRWRDRLLSRRIARFDQSNWWKYGAVRNADAMASDRRRIYVLTKTRSSAPFFTHPVRHYTGGVLGLFLRDGWEDVELEELVSFLNSPLYRRLFEGMFLTSSNKVSFQPATLADVPFPATPDAFRQALAQIHNEDIARAA